MNIGIVSPYDWDIPGGVNRHVEQLARYLRRNGHAVMVIAPGGRDGEGFRSVGGSFAVAANRSKANISFGPAVAAKVRNILCEGGFEVLHLHEPLIPSASMLALIFSRCAVLATFHAAREEGSLGYRIASPLLEPLAKRIDVRAVVSPAARDLVGRYFPGEYRVLPNGVDTEVFTPEGPRLEGLDPGGFDIVFVGRDEPRKGLGVLLEAMPKIRKERPEARLLVVGADDPGRGPEGVIWLGRLTDQAVPAAYRSARVMAAPSLGMESFGIVLVESMACGVPVVASDIPGYRAVVRDGVEGRLVTPGDARALAEALLELAADEGKREDMACSALARANEFSWNKLVGEVEEAYAEAVKGWRSKTDGGGGWKERKK